jgi:hypothetical protein
VTVTDEQEMVMAFVVVSYGTPIITTFDPQNYLG